VHTTHRAGFALRQQEGLWRLVTPGGQRFFSLGVCCVQQGFARKDFDPENPGYAAWKYYDNPLDWADSSLRRLKSWGFTTAGGWSEHETLLRSREMTLWLTPVLHIGATAGVPWWDMWDAKIVRRMEEIAKDQILAVRDDPRLIGYYTDNELGWWNASLFKMTLEQPAASGQRRRLLELLRETYQNDWKWLTQDFEAEGATNWSELRRRGMLFLRSGGQGIHVMRRFLGVLASRYYQLTRQIIRKYDRRALILGDRYQSFYYPEVAKAAAPYVDAISSNLNAHWHDGTFLRSYLETLHALTGKPILVSELYAAARDNRSGNKNSQGLYPVVATQAHRAETFRRTLATLAELPYVVGADWFQYSDEPTHGRADGENFNFGLVDIHDRPYAEMTNVVASLKKIPAGTAPVRADASGGIPRAPAEPMGQFEPGRAMAHWDREHGFVKATSEHPMADLYICWSPQAIYLGVYSLDIMEGAYYHGGVPKADRALWTVQINGSEPIRARLGAGREPIVSDPTVRLRNLSGLDLNVRNVAILEVPMARFGTQEFLAGDRIELSISLLSHAQAYRAEWNGKFVLKAP